MSHLNRRQFLISFACITASLATVSLGVKLENQWQMEEVDWDNVINDVICSTNAVLAGVSSDIWDMLDFKYQEGLGYLQDYVSEYGHARVPYGYKTKANFNLGQWATTQRRNYKNGKLPKDKIEKLSYLPGWTWKLGKI